MAGTFATQTKQKAWHDTQATKTSFEVGDALYAYNLNGVPRWLKVTVVEMTESAYIIRLVDGRTTCHHVEHIRRADSLDGSSVVGGTVFGEMGAMVVPLVRGEVENPQVKPSFATAPDTSGGPTCGFCMLISLEHESFKITYTKPSDYLLCLITDLGYFNY